MYRNTLVEYLLLLLGLLCIGNVNGLIYMTTGISQFGSSLILFCVITLLAMTFGSMPRFAWLVVVFIVSFLILALIFNALFQQSTPWILLLGPAGFAVIMMATASGFSALDETRRQRLLSRIAWVLTLVAVATLASPWLVSIYKHAPANSLRYSGVFLNPNTAAIVANVGFALCFSLYADNRKVHYLLLALVCVSAVILTFSKAGLLSLGAITLLCLSYRLKRRLWYISGAAVIALAMIWGGYTHWAPTLHAQQLVRIEAASRLMRAQIDEEVSTGRTLVWETAADQILDQGVLRGGGLGAMRYLEGGLFYDGAWLGVHNYWLVLLGEAGIVPFLFFLFIMIALIWRSFALERSRLFVQGYLLAFLVDTMASHNVIEIRYHAFLFGLVVSLSFAPTLFRRRTRRGVTQDSVIGHYKIVS